MTKKIDLQGTLTITTAPQMVEITKPLREIYGIPFFRYLKLFNDGSRIILCNQPKVMEYLYEKGHYQNAWYDRGKPGSYYPSGCLLWAIQRLAFNEKQKKFAAGIEKLFNLSQGIAYAEEHDEFIEIFEFGSSDFKIYDVDRHMLKHFIFYCKEQVQKLLGKEPPERIQVPLDGEEIICSNERAEKKEAFLAATPIDRYYLSGELEGNYLTDREIDCVNWCVRGKTAEEIATLLDIRKKTAERHLDNIKQKLKCYKQSQLICTALKQGIIMGVAYPG